MFEPNRLDAVTGGHAWSTPLAGIQAIGRQPRDGNPLSGGLRDRLSVDLADGTVELFVVNRLDAVIGVLQQAATPSH